MANTVFPRFSALVQARLTSLVILAALLLSLCLTGCGRPSEQATTASDSSAGQPDIFGKIIHFNGSYEAEPYKVSGWSGTEKEFTWTIGKAAVLALPVPPNSGAVRLRMFVSAYVHPPELPSQPVEVYANGQKVADWNVSNPAQNFADVPKEIVGKATTLTLQLRTPRAASPAEFSAKGDERILGICCNEMELSKLSNP